VRLPLAESCESELEVQGLLESPLLSEVWAQLTIENPRRKNERRKNETIARTVRQGMATILSRRRVIVQSNGISCRNYTQQLSS
jgi:hypothetical protein